MDLLLYLAVIPALAVAAQWLAWRSSLPGILLLLLLGVVLGYFVKPDQLLMSLTGGDASAGPNLLFPLVSLSVAVIMFEGGLSLKISELSEAGTAALRLVTVGAAITFALTTVSAHFTLSFPWTLSCLLGAILVVTGPTVIGPLIRQVRPTRRVANTLKWEGIVIDPIGAVLAVLVFENLLVQGHGDPISSSVLMLAKTALIGLVLGIAGGALLSVMLQRYWIPDHLHGVAALATGLILFAISNTLAHESGLITVTVMGISMANRKDLEIEHIIEFKENLRTLLIGCLFIVLGSRVDMESVSEIGWPGLLFVVILIVVIRPLSVFLSLLNNPLSLKEKAFVAGLAPRGIVAAAVSSVFALQIESHPIAGDVTSGSQLSTVTFLVIVGTVAFYGLTATPFARWLGLADESSNGVLIAGADAWVRDFAALLHDAGLPVVLVDTNFNKVSQARQQGLNAHCMNILNEHAREDLTLTGIGRFLAMTGNDEVNSLAVKECRHLFSRAGVYQLTFNQSNSHHRRGMTRNLLGRELFRDGLTFTELRDLRASGACFKATKLTDNYRYQDFQATNGDNAILIGTIGSEGDLQLNTVADPLTPSVGQTVIALITAVPVPKSADKTSGPSNDFVEPVND
ncbi:MAG: sodium:proton antiporter [Planctomycetota bacterium]